MPFPSGPVDPTSSPALLPRSGWPLLWLLAPACCVALTAACGPAESSSPGTGVVYGGTGAAGGTTTGTGGASAGSGGTTASSGGTSAGSGGATASSGGAASGGTAGTGAAPGTGGTTAAASGALLPWHEGNTWTYDVNAAGVVTRKITTVEPMETVGGTGPHAAELAYKVVTSKKDGTDKSVSWQAVDGDRVIRYREQAFSATTGLLSQEQHWAPYKLHVDGTPAHTVPGATWVEQYDETKLPVGGAATTATVQDQWTVEATGQTLTVPAGTFSDVIVFTKAQKRYWYVRGVGKLKETGTQTEELVAYTLVP